MWSQSLLTIALLFYAPALTTRTLRFKAKVRQYIPHLSVYTFTRFCSPCVVYLRVPVDVTASRKFNLTDNFFYIGETTISISSRETNRISKFNQIVQEQFVKAEPALFYWYRTNSFYDCTVVCLQVCDSHHVALALEHCLIATWKPLLNHPHIHKAVRHKSLSLDRFNVQSLTNRYKLFGTRLFLKLRRRRRIGQSTHLPPLFNPQQCWILLFELASSTRKSFEAEKMLRSAFVTSDTLYAMWRLSSHADQPFRSTMQRQLRKVFAFRNLAVPVSPRSLVTPFLAHTSFRSQLAGFLRSIRQRSREHLLPFPLPPYKPREAVQSKLCDLLFNFRSFQKSFCIGSPPSCTCGSGSSHIACPLVELPIPDHLREIVRYSATSTYFASKTIFMKVAQAGFSKWLCHYALPSWLMTSFVQWLEEQWLHHVLALDQCPWLITHRQCFQLKAMFRHLVIHNADHQASRLMAYCPLFYFSACLKTWSDPDVFVLLRQHPAVVLQSQIEYVCNHLPKQYNWAVQSNPILPSAYVLLKPKKNFTSGRPIIAHTKSILSRNFACLSILLLNLLQVTWPDHFGELRTPVIWKKLHSFLDSCSTVDELVMCNQDLVGFFTSMPIPRIELAVSTLMRDYCVKTNQLFESCTISVDVKSPHKLFRMFRGTVKPLQSLGKRPVHLSHVLHLVNMSFQLTAFQAMGTTWKQVRGTAIGSHISPALCCVAVAHHEQSWSRSFNIAVSSSAFCSLRYVDNRFILASAAACCSPIFQHLVRPDFYLDPVILEEEPGNKFLGFLVDTTCRTCVYEIPSQCWQFRHPGSAGSLSLNLSGLRSRLALICMYTYPASLVPHCIHMLCKQYETMGYPSSLIRAAACRAQRHIRSVSHSIDNHRQGHVVR